MQCGLKYTAKTLQTRRDRKLYLLLENTITRWISSLMEDRYVKTDEIKQFYTLMQLNPSGWGMSQSLHYDEEKTDKNVVIAKILYTPVDSEIGCLNGGDSFYHDVIKQKEQRLFLFLSKTKLVFKITLVTIWMEWNQINEHKTKSHFEINWWKKLSSSL